jgi:hypothetical protein
MRISSSNAGYTMFRGSVKGTGYPLHSPVSPSFPLPCVTVFHHISTGFYYHANVTEQKTQGHAIALKNTLFKFCERSTEDSTNTGIPPMAQIAGRASISDALKILVYTLPKLDYLRR